MHDRHPVKINGKYYLEFSGETRTNNTEIFPWTHDDFFKEWIEKRESLLSLSKEDATSYAEKERLYDLWRYAYILEDSKKTMKSLNELRKKRNKKTRT